MSSSTSVLGNSEREGDSTVSTCLSGTLNKLAGDIASIHKNSTTFPEACDVEFVIGRQDTSQTFLAMGGIMSMLSPVFR